MAQRTLDGAALAALRGRATAMAHEQTLPVAEVLEPCFPGAALVRGQVIVTCGVAEVSSALTMAARATQTGSWLVVVERPGVFEVGAGAAAESGVVLQRTVLVTLATEHCSSASEVLAALIDGFDLVIVPVIPALGATATRRLQARLRTRGGVVVVVGGRGDWQPDLVVRSTPAGPRGGWESLDRYGRLRRREVQLEVDARRRGVPGRHRVWMPSDDGAAAVSASDQVGTSVHGPAPAVRAV